MTYVDATHNHRKGKTKMSMTNSKVNNEWKSHKRQIEKQLMAIYF